MGDMDLGHGGHGTTRQGQTAKKTWVGRDVQSIIIILEADMVHVCAGIHFLRRYLLPVAKLVQAQVPVNSAPNLLPDFNQLPVRLTDCPHLQTRTRWT